MDTDVGLEPHELASFAGKHGMTEEKVLELVVQSGSRSLREIEETLEFHSRLHRHNVAF